MSQQNLSCVQAQKLRNLKNYYSDKKENTVQRSPVPHKTSTHSTGSLQMHK